VKGWPHLIKRATHALAVIASTSLIAAVPIGCRAQDLATEQETSRKQREDWETRVKASRDRIELIRREHRSFVLPPTTDETAEAASASVLDDETLVPSDIVSTTRGLFRFRGAPNRERTPEDFERVR